MEAHDAYNLEVMSSTHVRSALIILGMLLLVACSDGSTDSRTASIAAPATLLPTSTPVPTAVPTSTVVPTPALTSTPVPSPTTPPTPTPVPTDTPVPAPVAAPLAAPVAAPVATAPSNAAPTAEPSTSEEGDSPAAILERALTAILDAGSFRFEVDASVKAAGSEVGSEIPITAVGAFQPPDSFHTTLTVSLGFFSLDIETIAIGDTTYSKDGFTGVWEVSTDSGFAFPEPTEFVALASDDLASVELVGVELLDSVESYHLRSIVPQTSSDGEDTTLQIDAWVGVSDTLVRQIVVQGQVSLDDLAGDLGGSFITGLGDLSLTMKLYDYGEPVVIEAPVIP